MDITKVLHPRIRVVLGWGTATKTRAKKTNVSLSTSSSPIQIQSCLIDPASYSNAGPHRQLHLDARSPTSSG